MEETPSNPESGEKDLTGPAGLGEALRGLRKETVLVPASVDEKVLAEARSRLTAIRRSRARSRKAVGWLALAASVVACGLVAQLLLHRGPRAYAREDLNHDGAVDILDAFQLARELKQGRAIDPAHDFTGDGRVDAADVDYLAARAVSVGKGGPS